jgi:hypothetical protein
LFAKQSPLNQIEPAALIVEDADCRMHAFVFSFRAHGRARRVVPISELIEFATIAGTPRIENGVPLLLILQMGGWTDTTSKRHTLLGVIWSRITQSAWAACVRCGGLSGAKVSSLSETRMSPAVANSSCGRVRLS